MYMLQIFDRLLASIGQDTLDTLYWLAAENSPGRDHLKTLFYFLIAAFYVCILTHGGRTFICALYYQGFLLLFLAGVWGVPLPLFKVYTYVSCFLD